MIFALFYTFDQQDLILEYTGDLVHVRVFGQSILIINSFTVADELLEKRSLNTSDRYANTMSIL